jgi:hypothetical protein
MTLLTDMEYLCHKWPRICSTCRKHILVRSSFTTYHRICNQFNTTSATSRAETAYPSGVHPRFLVGFVLLDLVDRCLLSFCTLSFGQCVFSSSIYGIWLPLWYLQTLIGSMSCLPFASTWSSPLSFCVVYYMSLRSQFHVVMSITISAYDVRFVFSSCCL